MLINATTPLGDYIEYSLAPATRLDYIKSNIPKALELERLVALFKKDIYIEEIVEKVTNADLYYIETKQGRGDELYYFGYRGRLFHSEKVWSRYHSFVPILRKVAPSSYIEEPCWFVGSRNNYTHQTMDFLPNLLVRNNLIGVTEGKKRTNVLGKMNPILESLSELPVVAKYNIAEDSLFLEKLGKPVSVGEWNIRCIRFKELDLVRHISIFKAYTMLEKALNSMRGDMCTRLAFGRKILYLFRADCRVVNQNDVCRYLQEELKAHILSSTHRMSYREKASAIEGFHTVILPPGSDNINGLLFSSEYAKLIQMIATPISSLLEDPFFSYAGLRYVLPFMHRLIFWPASNTNLKRDRYSGNWDTNELHGIIK